MRISTSMIYSAFNNSSMNISSKLQNLSEQLSSGKQINHSSDDPVAYAQASRLKDQMAQMEQSKKHWNTVDSRNKQVENVIQDSMTNMSDLRTFLVNANNDYSWSDMKSTNIEYVKNVKNQLLALANSKNENNEYMFSGYQNTQPFITTSTGVIYNGDQGQRQLNIDNINVSLEPSGDKIYTYNNRSSIAITQTTNWFGTPNIGNAYINVETQETLSNNATLVFSVDRNTSPPVISADILDASGKSLVDNTIRNNGTYQSSNLPIPVTTNTLDISTYIGLPSSTVTLDITGTPEDGDSFSITKSTKKNIFDTLDALIHTMESKASSGNIQTHNNLQNTTVTLPNNVGKQQWQTVINQSISDIDDWLTNASINISKTGANQNLALDSITRNTAISDIYEERRSQIEDLDYANALMTQNLLTTQQQALYKTFNTQQSMSLFNYLA